MFAAVGVLVLAAWGAPQALPALDLEVPSPESALPALERCATWLARIEPELAPPRLRAASAELGVSFLDPASLKEVGIATDRPLRLLFDPDARTLSIQAAVKDRRRALAWLARLEQKIEGRAESRRWDDAILIDVGTPYLLAVVLERDRVLIQLPEAPKLSFFEEPAARGRMPVSKKAPRKWRQHARLAPLAALEKKKKFIRPKLDPDGPPALYFRSSGGRLAATAGALVANDAGFTVHLLWALDGRGQIAMGELMGTQSKARRLLDERPLSPAVSVRARLLGSGLRLLVGRLGVSESLTAGLGGGVHAVVTSAGELVLELEVSESFGEPGRAALEEALRRRVSAVKVDLDAKAGRLGILVGSPDVSGLRSAGPEDLAPLVLELHPERLLPMLGGVRDRYGPGYVLGNVELLAARMLLEPLVRATASARLELRPGGAAVGARADIRYRD